jgi:PAS domain S-box-containing protein
MNPRDVLILKWLVTFAAVFVFGTVGFLLPSIGPHPTVPLLGCGISAAACIRWGRQMWPAVFAAGAAIDLSLGQPVIASLGVGLGSAGAAVFMAWFLERSSFDCGFGRARDVPLFILATGIGTMIVPTLGLLGFFLSGDHTAGTSPLRWIRWWSNTTAGVLLVGPMLVAVSRQSLAQAAEHWIEAALWLMAVALWCAAMLSLDSTGIARPLVVLFAMLLIVFGAIRFGLVLASLGALLITGASGLSLASRHGVYGQLDEFVGLTTVWVIGAVLTGMNLIITALLDERDRAARERLRAEHRYAQIFDGSPQPLWVHDPDSLEFLLVNEAAVRQYGWSTQEFLAQKVTALAPRPGLRVLPPPKEEGADPAPEPFETRHQTRDGRVLEVEVWTRAIDLGGRRAELVFASDVTDRRALGSALIDAIANEQRRIGQELHDGLGQELTGLSLSARALATRAERERQPIAPALVQLATLATDCIQSARRIAQGVSPLSDVDGSLQGALEALASRSSYDGTLVRFHPRVDAPLDLDLEARNHLFRIAQEAVQNALKHARARIVDIELWVHPQGLRLSVDDDGVGLPRVGSPGGSLGMRTMHFRASSIGGRLLVTNHGDGGVSIVCEISRPKADSASA